MAAHRSYQNLLRSPSRSTDSPSPHDFIVIVQVGTESCAVAGHLRVTAAYCVLRYPAPSNIPSLIQRCHINYCTQYSTDYILLWGCCCITVVDCIIVCGKVTSDPPVRFGPFIGPTTYAAKQCPADTLSSIQLIVDYEASGRAHIQSILDQKFY